MIMRKCTYLFQPFMIICSDFDPPPSFKIKDIHTVEPNTTIMVKVG